MTHTTTATPRLNAYQRGKEAFSAGLLFSSVPYDQVCQPHLAAQWRDGWEYENKMRAATHVLAAKAAADLSPTLLEQVADDFRQNRIANNLMCIEFGFKAAERGLNIDGALELGRLMLDGIERD